MFSMGFFFFGRITGFGVFVARILTKAVRGGK